MKHKRFIPQFEYLQLTKLEIQSFYLGSKLHRFKGTKFFPSEPLLLCHFEPLNLYYFEPLLLLRSQFLTGSSYNFKHKYAIIILASKTPIPTTYPSAIETLLSTTQAVNQ